MAAFASSALASTTAETTQVDTQSTEAKSAEVESTEVENTEVENIETTRAVQMANIITQPYAASYELLRRGRRHGTASRVLTDMGNGEWYYETSSRASLLFLSDRRHNESTFIINSDRVQPLTYVYERRGTGSNRDYAVRFDHAAKELLAMNGSSVTAEWGDDLLDANAVLHQLQIDLAIGELEEFAYHLIDEDGRNIHYEFAITAREEMPVGGQSRNVIKVERVRDHDRRQTYFWFAPSLNYTLVAMQQIEGGKEQLKLELTALTFGN
ncbi:DUF3108 domain-containing protein [Aliidiomarina sp.]|uniref:DUF3108 domain-containing protein n=1 Tax=Aliidiomarina sp. TaxID=1872439 RepID=UPI003A4DAB63